MFVAALRLDGAAHSPQHASIKPIGRIGGVSNTATKFAKQNYVASRFAPTAPRANAARRKREEARRKHEGSDLH